MSPKTSSGRRWSPRSRTGRALAGALAACVAVAGVSLASGTGASGATAPASQSAGNFIDLSVGGQNLDSIVKLAYARAQSPGGASVQNPLDITLLNAINLPLTGILQLPQLLGINLGAANQVAVAKPDGSAYGASGAVLNSGAISVGGNNAAPPAGATINLTPSGIAGAKLPVPGGTGMADAIGGVTLQFNGISSIARTPNYGPPLGAGWPSVCTQASATCYDIATLRLQVGSPLVGQLLGQLAQGLLTTAAPLLQLVDSITGGTGALQKCVTSLLTQPISLLGKAVVFDPTHATLTFDLEALLQTLNLDINALPANTDLLTYVLDYLTSPNGLAGAITNVITSLATFFTGPGFSQCLAAVPLIGPALVAAIPTLGAVLTPITNLINQVLGALKVGGTSPLAPIAQLLGQILAIGINVQPQVKTGSFKTALSDLPKQGMTPPPPVPYEHTVRAIEIKVLNGALDLALANSAVGPSNPQAPSSTAPSSSFLPTTLGPPTQPPTQLPTGVPAGQATHGTPVAPIVLLILGLTLAAAGSVAWRVRGRHTG